MAPVTFSDRDEFLAQGIERAECSICRKPFDGAHWPYQIRECGHIFGRTCLEAWLQQSDSNGTCPKCESVLFIMVNYDCFGFTEEEVAISVAQYTYLRGYVLRLIDIHDSTGFLVKLWKEMRNAFGPDERETYEDAWVPRIVGLVRYLLEGLGLPDYNHDRVILNREIEAYKARHIAERNEGTMKPEHDPFTRLSRDMVQAARIFPRDVVPDPILWRAMICFHTLVEGHIRACYFQDCDDSILACIALAAPESSDRARPWHRPAARLYLLLVLMAQDSKHNLKSNNTYNAEDVERLLRAFNTPIMCSRWIPAIGTNISADFCERAARFHHRAQINNPQTVPSKELAHPRTRRGLIFCHVRGFWLSAKTPDTVEYDATDDHMRYGIEQGFVSADGDDDGSEAGDDVGKQVADEGV